MIFFCSFCLTDLRTVVNNITDLSEEQQVSVCKEAVQVCAVCEVDPIKTNARLNFEVIYSVDDVLSNIRFPADIYTRGGLNATDVLKDFLELIPAIKCEVEVTNVRRNDSDASTSNANPDNSDADPSVAFTNEIISHFLVFIIGESEAYPKIILYLDNSHTYYPVYVINPKSYTE